MSATDEPIELVVERSGAPCVVVTVAEMLDLVGESPSRRRKIERLVAVGDRCRLRGRDRRLYSVRVKGVQP